MTDLELTKLAAEAMEIPVEQDFPTGILWVVSTTIQARRDEYEPLHDDAQAMALLWRLVSEGTIVFSIFGFTFHDFKTPKFVFHTFDNPESFRRAIVECVAKRQVDRTETAAKGKAE